MFGVYTPDEREDLFTFITRLDVAYRDMRLEMAEEAAKEEKRKAAIKGGKSDGGR